MLSRIADHLYWLARYSERAENMARILDVADRMTLIPQPATARDSAWRSALEVAGAAGGLGPARAGAGGGIGRDVLRHLAFDASNPMSIVSCIAAMHENARALRGTITTEMLETINATWLDLEGSEAAAHDDPRAFFDRVKERSHLLRGVTAGTMLRDDALWLMEAGFAIERADNTARLLDSKHHVLLPPGDRAGGALDHYQWGALLRSLSAFRAYHRTYRDRIAPLGVAELVILDARFPRSLRACYDRLMAALHALGNTAETRRLAGRRHASLEYGQAAQILDDGLHGFLEDFVAGNAEVGERFAREFMMTR